MERRTITSQFHTVSVCFLFFVFAPYYSDVPCYINSCDNKKGIDIGEQRKQD